MVAGISGIMCGFMNDGPGTRVDTCGLVCIERIRSGLNVPLTCQGIKRTVEWFSKAHTFSLEAARGVCVCNPVCRSTCRWVIEHPARACPQAHVHFCVVDLVDVSCDVGQMIVVRVLTKCCDDDVFVLLVCWVVQYVFHLDDVFVCCADDQ